MAQNKTKQPEETTEIIRENEEIATIGS